jgi:hypothetical protein
MSGRRSTILRNAFRLIMNNAEGEKLKEDDPRWKTAWRRFKKSEK